MRSLRRPSALKQIYWFTWTGRWRIFVCFRNWRRNSDDPRGREKSCIFSLLIMKFFCVQFISLLACGWSHDINKVLCYKYLIDWILVVKMNGKQKPVNLKKPRRFYVMLVMGYFFFGNQTLLACKKANENY